MDIIDALPFIVVAHDIVHAVFIDAEDDLIGVLELRHIGHQLVGVHRERRTAAG